MVSNDKLRLLFESLGAQIMEHAHNPRGSVAMLMTETLRFRDKLKDETGVILTVEDTRKALDALECHLTGQPQPGDLSDEQRALARIYIDRLTLFS
ncbi:MAG: hypothetical protein D6800_02075 [Candidatus Zixiibacteriota bacterium]|nr:MAG: hypothetical protein D6800_02075 [candidate division Zixibacteria bacterium]